MPRICSTEYSEVRNHAYFLVKEYACLYLFHPVGVQPKPPFFGFSLRYSPQLLKPSFPTNEFSITAVGILPPSELSSWGKC